MVLGPPENNNRPARQQSNPREDQANSIDDQGRACMANGDYESALAYFQQAYDLSEFERFAKYYRADIARAKGAIASRNGSRAAETGDYQAAIRDFEEAVSLQPKVKGYRKQIAWAKGELESKQGDDAYRSGDLATALAHYKNAEKFWPDNVYRTVITKVGGELKDEKAKLKQDQAATAKIQDSIQRFAGELDSVDSKDDRTSLDFLPPEAEAVTPPASEGNGEAAPDLDFVAASPTVPTTPEADSTLKDAVNDSSSDKDVSQGSAGYKVAKVNYATVGPARAGTDTKAGDQVLAAAHSGGNLTPIYDIGGVKSAGSLTPPAEPAIDPSTFSTRVRNDGRMIEALAQLGALNASRSKLTAELAEATTEMAHAKDRKTMAELNQRMEQKNVEFQANLVAVTKAEEKVKKVHRSIDAEEAMAAGGPATKADLPGGK